MKIDYIVAFSGIQKQQIIDKYGLDGGRTQKTIDSQFMAYLDDYMPADTYSMINNMYSSTKVGSGEININAPYTHYQHEGEKYVDPKTGKGAFHDPVSGRYWSRPRYQKSAKWREIKLSWWTKSWGPFC